MLRIILFATSLMLTGAAGAEVYEGPPVVKREGLWYKPRSVEPFSGVQRLWYDSGQLSGEINFKDGKHQGPARKWFSTGQLWWEFNFKDGKRHGLGRSWDMNGDLEGEDCYSNGEKVDLSECA